MKGTSTNRATTSAPRRASRTSRERSATRLVARNARRQVLKASLLGAATGTVCGALALWIVASVGGGSAQAASSRAIVVAGAPSLESLIRKAEASTKHRARFELSSEESGWLRLQSGEVDALVSERPPRPAALERAAAAGRPLRTFPLAIGHAVVYAQPDRVPMIRSLDVATLSTLLFGHSRSVRWLELGVQDAAQVRVRVGDPSFCEATRAVRQALSDGRPKTFGPHVRLRSEAMGESPLGLEDQNVLGIAPSWALSDVRAIVSLDPDAAAKLSRVRLEAHITVRAEAERPVRDWLRRLLDDQHASDGLLEAGVLR